MFSVATSFGPLLEIVEVDCTGRLMPTRLACTAMSPTVMFDAALSGPAGSYVLQDDGFEPVARIPERRSRRRSWTAQLRRGSETTSTILRMLRPCSSISRAASIALGIEQSVVPACSSSIALCTSASLGLSRAQRNGSQFRGRCSANTTENVSPVRRIGFDASVSRSTTPWPSSKSVWSPLWRPIDIE